MRYLPRAVAALVISLGIFYSIGRVKPLENRSSLKRH